MQQPWYAQLWVLAFTALSVLIYLQHLQLRRLYLQLSLIFMPVFTALILIPIPVFTALILTLIPVFTALILILIPVFTALIWYLFLYLQLCGRWVVHGVCNWGILHWIRRHPVPDTDPGGTGVPTWEKHSPPRPQGK